MEERNRVLGEGLIDLLEQGRMQAALALLDHLHPADAAEVLEGIPYGERLRIFRVWDVEESSDALLEMSEDGQVEVMQGLARGLATRIIAEMPPDDAVDLLADLPPGASEDILAGMAPAKAGTLRRLLAHGEETAGGLMTPHAMRLGDDLTAGEVIEGLRKTPESVETIYYLYFQDRNGRLTGVSSLRELIVADPDKPVSEIMHGKLITVTPEEDQERVAGIIDRYDLLAVPVIDRDGRLLGIVTVDDVMDVIEEEAREDIYSLAGSWEAEEGRERDPFTAALVGRLPWLLIALALELVAAAILWAYRDTLRYNVALIFFIPAILALGGTVSLQSASRITLDARGEGIGGRRLAKGVAGECLTGLAIGILSGGVMGLFAWSIQGHSGLAWAVGVATFCAAAFAALVGSLLPLILKAAGSDPSKASGPFLATIMDISGLLVYLLVAAALI